MHIHKGVGQCRRTRNKNNVVSDEKGCIFENKYKCPQFLFFNKKNNKGIRMTEMGNNAIVKTVHNM